MKLFLLFTAPENHLTLSNRSQALLRLNQFHAALEDAESIVRLCPTWAKGHYHRGMALASLSRYEEALVSFLLCLALDHDMGAVQQEVTHALHRLLVGTPTGFRSRCHSLGLPAPYSLQGRRPRFLAASYPALNSSDCDDSSSGDEDFLQVPHRLSSSSLSSTVPQENTRLHALLDRIFQEIGKIRRTEMKPIDFPVNPNLVDQSDFDCVLCCRTLWQPVTTPCGHTYCWMCLDRCLDYSFACPLCMTSLADYLATSQKAVTEVIEHSLRLLLPAEYLARQVTHHQELSELAQLWGGQVPMFVCTTGFPGVPCPLYVYEPRYRVMMRHCAEAGSREFGIVACLTKDPGTKSYAEFGTMLEIRDWILLDNGCSILTTVELLELHERVRPKAWQWFDSLEAELQSEIVRAFGQMPGLEEDWPSLPDGPAWTWWLLAFLPLSQELKVEILATTSLEKRLRAIDKTLDRIQAAAVARQEQTMAVDSVEHQQNTNASHQPSLQHQNEDSTNSSRHVATASRDPPSHMFSGRFLGTNRERVRVVEPS
ncbi:LON peptidase N-terminal domain and RING finger protein 3 [Blattella germanica]|nr:LON peptidase N-terminal domain and RING finger protein 3 [Blattella germanica]